jgi:hypothetical protein
MTIAEKIELALIPAFGIGVWLIAPGLPDNVGVGQLLLATSAFLLFESLIRDLWLLIRDRRVKKSSPRRKDRCMCIESTVGATGVIVGLVLPGSGMDYPVTMNNWTWSLLVITIMILGFMIKDYVVELGPIRVRRDKDHMNIIFTWKK